jgi:hypothetical protein
VLFLQSDEGVRAVVRGEEGKYLKQQGVTLPKI